MTTDADKRSIAVLKLGHEYTGVSKAGFAYSLNEENYETDPCDDGFATREEALDAAHEAYVEWYMGDGEDDFDDEPDLWTGRLIRKSCAGMLPDIEGWLLEQVKEQAYEWVGDWADGYLNETMPHGAYGELRYALMRALDQWADKYKQQPTFFGIEETEKHTADPAILRRYLKAAQR